MQVGMFPLLFLKLESTKVTQLPIYMGSDDQYRQPIEYFSVFKTISLIQKHYRKQI